MDERKSSRKALSGIISAIILSMILGFSIVVITSYTELETSKIETAFTMKKALHKTSVLENIMTPNYVDNNLVTLPGLSIHEVEYIVMKTGSNQTLKIFDKDRLPDFILSDANGTLIINKTQLTNEKPSEVILLLKEGGTLNLSRVLSKTQPDNTGSLLIINETLKELVSEMRNETMLDTLVKSLLSPSDLYRIYIRDGKGATISTREINMTIPIELTAIQRIIERSIETSREGCPLGKVKPLYLLLKTEADTVFTNGGTTIYNVTVPLSLKAYAGRYGSAKDSFSTRTIYFKGTVNESDGEPLFRYKGWLKITHVARSSSPWPSYCTNNIRTHPPHLYLYVDIEITIEKIDPSKGVILVLPNRDIDIIRGANVGPSIDKREIYPGSTVDQFLVIYSPPGNPKVVTLSENTVYIKIGGALTLRSGPVEFNAILQLIG